MAAPKEWLIPSILLITFGFFKESLPSEPFLTPYLVQYKNISEEAVTNQIYPIWTYSYMGALIPVFLFTDFLRYKPIIVFEGCAFLATYALLLWAFSIRLMQLMQMFYAFASASEIAYYSYLYAVVSPDHYKQVASYTRTAVLMGNFVAGTLGQLIYSLSTSEDILFTLHVLSMASVSVATAITLFLPKADKSQYFHRDERDDEAVDVNGSHKEQVDTKNVEEISQNHETIEMVDGIHQNLEASRNSSSQDMVPNNQQQTQAVNDSHPKEDEETPEKAELVTFLNESAPSPGPTGANASPGISEHDMPVVTSGNCCVNNMNVWQRDFHRLVEDFKMCYSNKQLVKWSLWWACATCGAHQVSNYVQTLWQVYFSQSDETHVDIIYNGAVIAAATLVGALASFSLMFTKLNWSIVGEIFIGLVSVMQSVILITMSLTDSIWLCYVFFVIFRASYQLVKTIATYQIAKHLTVQRYGLVFGCNTFIAAVLQSILTLVVVDYRTLNASPEKQFLIYGGCFFTLGSMFCCKALYTMTINGWRWSWENKYDVMPNKGEDE